MKQRILSILVCFLAIGAVTPVAASMERTTIFDTNADGPHVDFLVGPEVVGWSVTIWNYGSKPAFFIHWKIETKGVNGTRVIGGDRRGVILCLRSRTSRFMAPFTLPQTKTIFSIGNGEVEITVRISCRNANYSIAHMSYWILNKGRFFSVQQQM